MAGISHLVASVKLDFFAAGELSSLEDALLASLCFFCQLRFLFVIIYTVCFHFFFGFKEAKRALYSETRLFAVTISSQSPANACSFLSYKAMGDCHGIVKGTLASL